LWRDATKAGEAAAAMKSTAADAVRLGVVDGIVAEPPGGAHADPLAAAEAVGEALRRELRDFRRRFPRPGELDQAAIVAARHERYRRLGQSGITLP
jgi:acetyl-CoA carboxylase carboxyl transferase subunit alpha